MLASLGLAAAGGAVLARRAAQGVSVAPPFFSLRPSLRACAALFNLRPPRLQFGSPMAPGAGAPEQRRRSMPLQKSGERQPTAAGAPADSVDITPKE